MDLLRPQMPPDGALAPGSIPRASAQAPQRCALLETPWTLLAKNLTAARHTIHGNVPVLTPLLAMCCLQGVKFLAQWGCSPTKDSGALRFFDRSVAR